MIDWAWLYYFGFLAVFGIAMLTWDTPGAQKVRREAGEWNIAVAVAVACALWPCVLLSYFIGKRLKGR